MRISAANMGGFAGLGQVPGLADLLRRFAVWREVARQRRALASLSPEMLRDIGLDVDAAAAEADRAFWDVHAHRR